MGAIQICEWMSLATEDAEHFVTVTVSDSKAVSPQINSRGTKFSADRHQHLLVSSGGTCSLSGTVIYSATSSSNAGKPQS